MAKQSWVVLQSMSPSERLRTVTRALRAAHKAGKIFSPDGTMNGRPVEAYGLLFAGQPTVQEASNLTQQLLRNKVLRPAGKRGRYSLVTLAKQATPVVNTTSAPFVHPQPVAAPERGAALATEEDQLDTAHQRALAALDENRQQLADLETAVAVRDLLVSRGVDPGQFPRIFKLINDHI